MKARNKEDVGDLATIKLCSKYSADPIVVTVANETFTYERGELVAYNYQLSEEEERMILEGRSY